MYELIKDQKIYGGNGKVLKIRKKGAMINVDLIEARRLMARGFIEDPNKVVKPKQSSSKDDNSQTKNEK